VSGENEWANLKNIEGAVGPLRVWYGRRMQVRCRCG
jgi:hypothetical protein